MTQAFNLALLANNVNTAGKLDASAGLVNATPVANGGTGSTSLTANNVLLGNGTSAVQAVAPGTSGNVLTSNGTTWTSAASSFAGARGQAFTSNQAFTIPSGITALKITVVGGGGGACSGGQAGAAGGAAISYLTGLTPGATLSVTVGGAGSAGNNSVNGGTGGTSQVYSGTQTISTISATGGAGGTLQQNTTSLGGIGSGGTLNIRGGPGGASILAIACGQPSYAGMGGNSILGGGGTQGSKTGGAYGGGGANDGTNTAGAGAAGVVIIEW